MLRILGRLGGALVLVMLASACSEDSSADRNADARAEKPSVERNEFGDGLAAAADDEPEYALLEIPKDAPLVAFLGDSISSGLHLPADQAFPAHVQRLLLERGLPFRLINAGVSGDTTAGGLTRTDWLLQQSPDVLVVEFGANDGLRGISVDSMRANLEGIVAKARAAECPVLLLGVRVPPSLGQEYSEQVAAIYHELAGQYGLAFVPFFMEGVGGVKEFTLPDGLHPNALGHERLAENVEASLARMLQDV